MVRCIMFEYVSRPQSLKKVKIKPGRPKGRQKLEVVMSKNGIGWEIVEEEPWGRQLGRVVAPPFIFISAPVVAAPVASTPTVTTPMFFFTTPMVSTVATPAFTIPSVTTPPITTPPITTSNQLPPTTEHHSQATAQEDVCMCRDVNRYLLPPLQRPSSRNCSCSSTRTVEVIIEESIDTLAEMMQKSWQIK